MVDARFFEYVSELLNGAGHMITSVPIYMNHSASETLYIDSNKDVTTSRFERTMLMQLGNVSLLTKMTWPGVVEDLTETVHIYSISIDVPDRNRSQFVADSHRLLHQYWNCQHSIVFFKNRHQYVISFANKDQSHILSDWFDIKVDYDEVVEKIDISNISLNSSNDYFADFIYAVARKYYLYPISVEEATYSMIPLTFVASAFGVKTEASKDDVKTLAKANLLYYETLYGDDYVAPVLVGYDEQAQFQRMATELDRISFELELAAELDEEVEVAFDDSDDDLGEFDDDFDEEFDDDLDPAIFDDPILMVKWLEQHQNQYSNESVEHTKPLRHTTRRPKNLLVHDSEGNAGGRRINEVVYESADHQKPVVPENQVPHKSQYGCVDVEAYGRCDMADELIKMAHIKRAEARDKRQGAYRLREEATQLMQDSISALSLLTQKRKTYEDLCKMRDDAAAVAYSQKQQIADRNRKEAGRLHSIAINKREDAIRIRKRAIDTRSEAEKRLQETVSQSNKLAELRLDVVVRRREFYAAERREQERLEAERREQERLEAERREQERLEAEQREQERLEAERREQERLEAERREQERLEAERREQERLEAERREQERLEAEHREQERLEAERRQQEELRQIHHKELLRIQQKKNEDLSAISASLEAINKRLKEIEQRLSALTLLHFVEKRNLKAEQAELIERRTNLSGRYCALENEYKALFAEENRRYEDSVSQFVCSK